MEQKENERRRIEQLRKKWYKYYVSGAVGMPDPEEEALRRRDDQRAMRHFWFPTNWINHYDNADPPLNWCLIDRNVFHPSVKIDETVRGGLTGCDCAAGCCLGTSCPCHKTEPSTHTYNSLGKLAAINRKGESTTDVVVTECNHLCKCKCGPRCGNNIVGTQGSVGTNVKLQVFYTGSSGKGWGLRTLVRIPQGAYVLEYIGEVVSEDIAEARGNPYLWTQEYKDKRTGRAMNAHTIDGAFFANESRFMNHSCNPNLEAVETFIHARDRRFSRITFFAIVDIEPWEELTFNYGMLYQNKQKENWRCECGWCDGQFNFV